jgi:ribose/xylose/arabinose/galactoside ABC-type transport system permease subunit
MTIAAAIVVHQGNGQNSRLTGAILLVLLVCGIIGLINGFLVAVARLNAMIVTLAMTGVIGGIMVIWIGTTFSTTGAVSKNLADLARERVGFLSVIAIIGVALILLLAFLLRSSALGRSYVAAGTNRVAAEIIGVRVVWYEMGGYVLAAIFYGIAGVFLAGLLSTPDVSVGDPYQLATIIAVALGGAALAGGPASLLCTIGGCFFVALLGQYLQAQSYSAGVSQITNGVVLILAVALVTAGSGGRLRGLTSALRR